MADTHCFIGTREVGKPKLRTTSSGSSNKSGSHGGSTHGHNSLSDILRMRRLRLNRAKTTTASSLSDSLSDSLQRNRSHCNRTNSNSLMSTSSDLTRNNSTHSYQSAKSTRSNMTAMTTLSSASMSSNKRSGKRFSKYDEDLSVGGINEKELNSMNKHIPALRSHGKSATFRQHYYPEGGWGWVITFCSFLVNIFTTGLQLSFSVLYLEILDHCASELPEKEKQSSSVVWIGSTNLALSHLLAPFLVALCRRKSARLTAVIGGLVMALSLLFASFAKQYDQIFLSYGIVCGIGCAMVRETSSLMLGQYFKRRRELVEALSSAGIGFGIAIFSNVYHLGLGSLGWRLGLQAVTGSAISLFFLGLFYRSASLYHPQRRAILHLKDMSKRKGKDKNKIESKPPYFDFEALAIPPFQVLLTAVAVASAGIYTPLFFLIPLAIEEGLGISEALLLQTFLGVATSIGAISFGCLILSKSQQCMISRQYLLQASIFGIGISMLALASVEGYHGYLMFVWMYGIFFGGMEVTLKTYCYERLKIKQYARGWGYIQGVRALPLLIGFPICAYISRATEDPKAGFYFSFTCCILGATIMFLLECFKGGAAHEQSLYQSKMDLCKMDTNMSLENGSVINLAAIEKPLPMVNGHLKCTCLPSNASDMEAKIKDLEASQALAEVSVASNHHSKVTFDDEIQVVKEVKPDEEDEEIINLAEALYAAGVTPEDVLASIAEEEAEETDSKHSDMEFGSPALQLRYSSSLPDLGVFREDLDVSQLPTVKRQKTWHAFKPNLVKEIPNLKDEEQTSFV